MTRHPATRLAAVLTATAATIGLAYGLARGAPVPDRERALAGQLARERAEHRAEKREIRQRWYARGHRDGRRQALSTPDAHIAFRLAGIAYGQSPAQMLACARSEGYREAERYQPENRRPNGTSSGAVGAVQFMPGTFRATPQGRAGLSIYRVDVQAHAMGWMWSRGYRSHWTGKGC